MQTKGYLVGQNWQKHTNVIKLWPLSVRKKKSAEALDRTTKRWKRFQMGPTYLSLVYKHPQYKVEGCWSYTERMILAVTGPFFFFLDAYIAYRVRTPVEEC